MSIKHNQNFILIDEKYPHIASKMLLFEGDETFNMYINSLLMDTREHSRQGFPPEISRALLNLLECNYWKK